MRTLEIAILVVLGLLLLRLMLPSSTRKLTWLNFPIPPLVFSLIFAHILFEGSRWQMQLAYLLISLLTMPVFFGLLIDRNQEIPRQVALSGWGRGTAALLGGFLLLLTFGLPFIFPVPQLPEPTGPFDVGTVSVRLRDVNRDEIYTADPNDKREFMAQFWYPAQAGQSGISAPLLTNLDVVGPALAERFGFPTFMFNHIRLAETHARFELDMPLTDQVYPVIIFSHGYNSLRSQSTSLMEELASHGYVVIALDHTYGGAFTIFPEGRIEFLSPDALTGEGEAYFESARRLGSVWEADIRFLVSQLPRLQGGEIQSPFAGHLDLDRIGLLGHSTGSGVMARLCAAGEYCLAGVGMDAWFGPVSAEVREAGSERPFLFLMSEIWPKPENIAWIDEYRATSTNAPWLTIARTAHYDFTDIPLFTPLSGALGLSGDINSQRGNALVRIYVREFFDLHIRGEGTDRFDGPSSDAPEVTFR